MGRGSVPKQGTGEDETLMAEITAWLFSYTVPGPGQGMEVLVWRSLPCPAFSSLFSGNNKGVGASANIMDSRVTPEISWGKGDRDMKCTTHLVECSKRTVFSTLVPDEAIECAHRDMVWNSVRAEEAQVG